MLLQRTIVLSVIFTLTVCYNIKPGPQVIATKGEVWPRPQSQIKSNEYLVVQPGTFRFQATNETCDILQEAFDRYLKIINNTINRRKLKYSKNVIPIEKSSWKKSIKYKGTLNNLNVELTNPCENNDIPDAFMKESYNLQITPVSSNTILKSNSIWGILRGLETFSQLLYLPEIGATEFLINKTSIIDHPRFKHRGLLLDTSRHFMPMPIIKQILDGMTYNKLNVFHWHIVDDQSFPYQSPTFPELSNKGAYHKSLVYTPSDVKKVITYAARRGIRVMAEFDTPGHTRSWGEGRPELLTVCYEMSKPNGYLGPVNPILNTTYLFMKTLFEEISITFPDNYIHLGGDEVDFDCWQSNPDIINWMEEHNLDDYAKLEDFYLQKLVDIVDDLNASSVVWHEVYENGIRLPKSSIVHVWLDNDIISRATKDGYRAIWSSCWYLDHLDSGGDWIKYYKCDPHLSFKLTPEQEKLVIGGEACMWAEAVDATNVVQRIFPRASAVAEKLWSAKTVTDVNWASRRLEEHACRMNIRGLPAQPPNGPGFCI